MIPNFSETVNGGEKGKGPFVDWKMALFLSYARNGQDARSPGKADTTGTTGVSPVVSAESVFHYIYGVLHSPAYRAKFREFLKTDFPRIPYPKGAAEFRRIAAIGKELVDAHLMRDAEPSLSETRARFPVPGDNVVAAVRFEIFAAKNADDAKPLCPLRSLRQNKAGRVYINDTQYFDNVPERAWEMPIGGYQPAQKWLKDRKGRSLALDDIKHYRRIVMALLKTSELMERLKGEKT